MADARSPARLTRRFVSGTCRAVAANGSSKGHTSAVLSVAWTADGRALSAATNGVMRVWDLSIEPLEPGVVVGVAPSLVERTSQLQYTNAKVLLVGDSGVGKSGLANQLALGKPVEDDKPLASTDGAWASQWKLPHSKTKQGVEREIWLWDFAGQVDYRLVHQLFMDDTAAAVLVFDPQKENPYDGLGQWDRDLQKAARMPFAKLLAAGRIDRGGLIVSDASIEKFRSERGFHAPLLKTSAKTGEGCDALRDAIVDAIDWDSIPITTSLALYHRMKEETLRLRDSGIVLMRLAELKQRMELALVGEAFTLDELKTAIGHLAGPGMIQRLDFGGFLLLRPEVLSRYAAALVRKVRKHPQELGCIHEDELLAGALDYQDFDRLPHEDEAVVLRTLHETVVKRAWCLRHTSDQGVILTFPSYFRRVRPPAPERPRELVSYRFSGPIDEIYATLVVRLHHTVAFDTSDLWRDAAEFVTMTGAKLGLTLTREPEGAARLDAYFGDKVDENSRVVFMRYVHEHLKQQSLEGNQLKRLRSYFCSNSKCDMRNEPFPVQSLIDKALAPGGKGKVSCPECGRKINLLDTMEQKFDSPEIKEEVRKEQLESQAIIDNESRELILVGHAYAIAAEAGQIYRGYTNSDHGIDGEIEFKDDEGRASGQRLYLQLKSGSSYLTKRKRDEAEIFRIKNPRWADYWQQQAYPVMLVIRTEDGSIRWMDVSEYLRRESRDDKEVRQIEFNGELFSALSVREWREKVLAL